MNIFSKPDQQSNPEVEPVKPTYQAAQAPSAQAQPASQQQAPASEPRAASVGSNFISKDVAINGKVKLAGDITIDGKLSGEIISKGVVTLSTNAVVKANIFASKIVIAGRLDGDATATGSVEVHNTAIVQGDVKTASLKADPGSSIVGTCHVGPNVKVEAPKSAVAATKPAAAKSAQPQAKPAQQAAKPVAKA